MLVFVQKEKVEEGLAEGMARKRRLAIWVCFFHFFLLRVSIFMDGDLEDVRRGRVEEKWVMNQVGHVGDKF